MGYFKEKSDLEFVEGFKSALQGYYAYKNRVDRSLANSSIQRHMLSKVEPGIAKQVLEGDWQEYQDLRTRIAKDVRRVHLIGHRRGVGIGVTSYPAPAVGGPILRFNIFDAILEDNSHGQRMSEQNMLDKLNEIIGACEDSCDKAWRHLVNPFYWIKAAFIFVLRIPANLIALAGFDVEKFEEQLWGKVLNLIWILTVIGILLALGLSRGQVVEIVRKAIFKN